MHKLVIATTNHNKVKEMRALLKDMPFMILSLSDFKNVPEVVEDGKTFKDNAAKKALTIAQHTGCLTLADDSGLEVDALNGDPGVLSARYAGEEATDDENNKKLLAALQQVPLDRRTAAFRCAIAIALPDKLLGVVEGMCTGSITDACRGSNGFGYDPLFVRLESNKTFAELLPDVKNRISHRGRALEKAVFILIRYLDHTIQ